jgi:hypothetical protein
MGAAGAFFLNGLSFAAVVLVAVLMQAQAAPAVVKQVSAVRMVVEGLEYVRADRLLATLLGLEIIITLCTSYTAILPVFADEIFGVGPAGLGLLMSAPGLGGLVGSLGLATRGDVAAKGRLMLISGTLYGVALIGFAAAPVFGIALVVLVVVGVLDTVYATVRNTIVQLAAAEDFRGRVISLNVLTQRGMGPAGNFVTGMLASAVGAPLAVGVLAGVATVVMAWRALGLRGLREYR